MDIVQYKPIGIIHTPFKPGTKAPFQPFMARGTEGLIELDRRYAPGLRDLDGFSHVYLLFHLHLISDYNLEVVPAWDHKSHGLFTTRSPRRPNPIGLSVVRIKKVFIDDAKIEILDVDMIDGTPLLDIKPYISLFEPDSSDVKMGWLDRCKDKIKQYMK